MRGTGYWVLGTVALGIVTGCGSSAPEPEHAGEVAEGPPPAPLSLVPAEAFAIVRVDLAQLRRSPHWPTISGWLDDAQEAGVEAGEPLENMQLLRQTLESAEEVVIATVPSGTPGVEGYPVVIARGSFREESLRRLVQGRSRDPASVRTREDGDLTVLVGPEMSGVQIGAHTWLIAPEPQLEAVLGRYRSGGAPIASDALRQMAQQVSLSEASAAIAVEVLPDLRAQMMRRLRRIPGVAGVEQASTVGARLELGSGLHLIALAHMQSEAAAEELASRVRGVLGQYSGNIAVRLMGIGPVFDGTTVTAGGAEARLVTQLDDATTRDLFDRLGSFIRLALQSVVIEMATPRASAGVGAP